MNDLTIMQNQIVIMQAMLDMPNLSAINKLHLEEQITFTKARIRAQQ